MELLPRLKQAGVAAVKIEGRQRGQAYVRSVTRTWRKAIDRLAVDEAGWQPLREWQDELSRHAEGHQTTLGPYHRSWHRSEEHTSELQSLMRISYAVFCLKKKNRNKSLTTTHI